MDKKSVKDRYRKEAWRYFFQGAESIVVPDFNRIQFFESDVPTKASFKKSWIKTSNYINFAYAEILKGDS